MICLTGISTLLNVSGVFLIFVLWFFLEDEHIVQLTKHEQHGENFLQWFQLCQVLYDTRRFFWFMLGFVLVFLGLACLILATVLALFYAYERRHGRIY